jgi:hypothetical protein
MRCLGVVLILFAAVGCASTRTTGDSPAREVSTSPSEAEPMPPPSKKRGVILPPDVPINRAPPATAPDTGTAGSAIGPK